MSLQPKTVEVRFAILGYGIHVEQYDILNENDRACWHVNSGTHSQISVTETAWIEIPDHRVAAWHRLLRRVGNRGKKQGLVLRKKTP